MTTDTSDRPRPADNRPGQPKVAATSIDCLVVSRGPAALSVMAAHPMHRDRLAATGTQGFRIVRAAQQRKRSEQSAHVRNEEERHDGDTVRIAYR